MAKKKEISDESKVLKSKLQAGKAVLGAKSVLKALRKNTIATIFLARNCPPKMKKDIQHYAQLLSVPVVELAQDNEELGILCKKNFFVSVLGTSKD